MLKSPRSGKKNSLSFEDAAKSHSKDAFADKGGDMGTIYYYELKNEFVDEKDAESLINLKKGDISPVYKQPGNMWAFYRVNTEATAPDLSKPEVLEQIRNYIFDQ